MKESISYSFLLNIIILFITVCAAIVAGIFSYYRAFKANNIIMNEIERYEGYNVFSEESISRKLGSITYHTPFKVKCEKKYKNVDSKKYGGCISTDDYAIVSYNVDYNEGSYAFENDGKKEEILNSKYSKDGNYTHKYRFGVYTYMYVDLPIVSNLIKIPVFSMSKIMYEFRNLKYATSCSGYSFCAQLPGSEGAYDLNYIPNSISESIINNDVVPTSSYLTLYSYQLLQNYNGKNVESNYTYGYDPEQFGNGKSMIIDYREAFKYYSEDLGEIQSMVAKHRHTFGYIVDWSAY